MATNDDDSIQFIGMMGQLTITMVNPYSGESIYMDEQKNINTTSYDGLGGEDIMSFTNLGDALFIVNSSNVQVVKNIEYFVAGDGGDVISLAHGTITTSDLQIFGGAGDDILWANAGNDLVIASSGDDRVDGGPGNDRLEGGGDNDRMNGGHGDDKLFGDDGNDILYGGNDVAPVVYDKTFNDNVIFPHLMEGVNIVDLVPPGTPALGYAAGNMEVNFAAKATLTFREGFAGYNNTLGIYHIATDGTIDNASILWINTKTAGVDIAHEIDLPVGANGGKFGFFIIADGDNVNGHYAGLNITGDGVFRFVYDYGLVTERAATVNDSASHVKMIYDDGVTERVINGPNYHTTERGGDTDLNTDGQEHMVSGLVDVGQQDVLRIGFEDLPNLGDADFEDVFFDFNINEVIVEGDSENGSDTLVGGAGNDTLYGQDGNDLLFVGEGVDDIYGGNGNDQVIYDFMDGDVDTIHGFEMGAGHDVLNITDILDGYDAGTDVLSNFVQFIALNGDTHVRVNADGNIGGAFTEIAVMAGVETTLAEMINNANLVVNQHVTA